MSDCIFCKIANGEIPATKVYENDMFIVIMDKFPATKGHLLIIPKQHAENIYDLQPEVAKEVFPLAQKMANALYKALSPEGINLLQNNGKAAGQTVFHFHIHLIPIKSEDLVYISWKNQSLDDEEITRLSDSIINAL